MKHMRYQRFIEAVKKHMQETLDKEVYVKPVLKNNGTVYDGLIIMDPLVNISPTIYLNPYYHRYLGGVSLEDIYDDILKTYEANLPKEDFDISIFTEYEKAQKRIIMKLINAKKNRDLLKMVPHILIYDLAIVFLCGIYNFKQEFGTILIYNEHMDLWNATTQDLYELAKKNTIQYLPPRLDNLHDVFEHITDESLDFLDDLEIYILTNRVKINGATCMVYPELISEIADLYEDDLIIIPSSIHEVLVFPLGKYPFKQPLEDLNLMIENVNETQLTDDEILSDHIYHFHRDTKEMTY